jgi:hypothetical protein
MNIPSRDSQVTMMRSFKARRAGTLVLALALWLLSPPAGGAEAAAIFDHLNEPAAWIGPGFQYGNPATGKAWFANGMLTIRHSPVGRWHTVSMSRTWETDPRQGLWVHFRFRIKEMLLGADLCATVSSGILIHRPGETNALPEALQKLPWPKPWFPTTKPGQRDSSASE